MPSLPGALRIACCAALLLSCHSPKKLSGTQYRLMDTITVSARNNPMELYRAASPRVWEIVHTGISLRFDFQKREAIGEALLTVMAYANPVDTLTLDAKSMSIASVVVMSGGGARKALPYSYDGNQLRIDVRSLPFGNVMTKQAQEIRIEYTAKPYAAPIGGSAAISEDRGLYFINADRAIPGKPVQIWTQGETESNSHWMPTIDKPNQRSTFDISLTVPDTMLTLSNGQLLHSEPAGPGLRRDEWRMVTPIQVYAAMFAIGRFDITQDESFKDPQGNVVPVNYYTEPAFTPNAKAMFKRTPEMIAFFSRFTGVPYPWNKYSQVVVRDYVSGAMENTSASLFGEFANKDRRQLIDESNEDVISHELFHQWFGDYVTAESWSNLTLNESFATYGEVLWRRYRLGQVSADELAGSDLQRYLAAAGRADPPLVRYYYRDKEEMFDRVSYQKGGAILRYIHSLTGDTLFGQAMQQYLRRNALESAEASQWRLALEMVTGKDWTTFFNQWYYRGGHPVLNIHYAYDDAASMLKATVRQVSSPDSTFLYSLPLKAAIISDSGVRTENWVISSRTATYNIPYVHGKRPVLIPDAAHVLPAAIAEDKPLDIWEAQLSRSGDYISKRRAIDAAIEQEAKPLAPFIADAALKDSLRLIRLYTLQRLAGIERKAWKEALLPQVKYLLATDGNNKIRAAAFVVLGAWKDRSEAVAMAAAVSDSSYLVAGSALAALTNIQPDTSYTLATIVLRQQPRGLLRQAAWNAIVSRGMPADLARLQYESQHQYGTDKVALAENIERYALAVKDDSLFDHVLSLLAAMAKAEQIRGYRASIGNNVFEAREAYRKGSRATRRSMADKWAAQVMADEPDEENRKKYKTLFQ